MTIYIHFGDTTRPARRIHNVEAVTDDGAFAVRVRMQFANGDVDSVRYEGVSHVAIQTSRGDA